MNIAVEDSMHTRLEIAIFLEAAELNGNMAMEATYHIVGYF